MKEFLKKFGQYFERSANWGLWSDVGFLYGADNWPLMLAIEQERARRRKIVFPPVLDEQGRAGSEIRIRARIDSDFPEICHFMADRTILKGYSAHFDSIMGAQESPLAAALFQLGGVTEVVLHETLVRVTRDPAIDEEYLPMACEIGQIIRDHLRSGQPAVSREFLARIPPEEEIIRRVDHVIDDEINPAISHHAGGVRLARIENNTVWINMGGSCQGCAAAPLTFRHGIGEALRRAVPQLGAIYDATDHSAGINPYFVTQPRKEESTHEAA